MLNKGAFEIFIDNLTEVQLGETNTLKTVYNGISEEVQTIFYNHFADKIDNTVENIQFWQKMNKTEDGITAARMKAWRDMPNKCQFVRREMTFLDSFIYINKNVVKEKLNKNKTN